MKMYLFQSPEERTIEYAKLKRRELEALRRIYAAWKDEGINPRYHTFMKDDLRRRWPVLAKALDRI